MPSINSFLKTATLFFILALVAILSCSRVWDLDLWMHLQTGRYIISHSRVPQADIYSYTSPGQFWFNPNWLFAVVAYLAYKAGGFPGLVILRLVVFLSVFYLLFRLLFRSSRHILSLGLLFLAVLVCRERIVERPEMFSFLFTVIYLSILYRFRQENTRLIWLLLPLQILWVNFHAFAVFGIIFIWVFIIAEYINLKIELPWEWSKSSVMNNERLKHLFCVGLWAIIVTCVNPYGIRIFKEYFSLLGWMHTHIDTLAGGIVELRPPFIERRLFGLDLIYYKILILISQASFLLNYRKINLGNLFLYFMFLYLSLVAVRNIAFFGLISIPIIAENLANFLQRKEDFLRKIPNFLKQAIAVFSLSAVITGCVYFSMDALSASFIMHGKIQPRIGFGESPIHPKEAIDFILRNEIKGNGFNNFGFGGYLIWRAWPELKVFVDGRTSVYDEEHLHFYANVFLYPYIFDQLVEDYNINYFLLDINSSGVLLKRLHDDNNWRLVFFDANGLVFVKNIPENKAVIDRYAIDFENWRDPEPDIEIKATKFRQKRIYPLSYFKKAVFFDMMGNAELARRQYERAVEVNPYIGELYNNIGATYQAEGKLEEALDYYEKALLVNPRLPSAHANLGFIYEKLGRKEEAIVEYKKATSAGGLLCAEAHNNLGCIYFEKGLYRKAVAEFRKAISINYGRAEYHFNLGSVFQAMGLIEQAISSYRETIRIEPDNIKAYNNLGACYLAKGDLLKAKRACEKVLEIEPDNEMAKKNLEGILQKIEEQKAPPK